MLIRGSRIKGVMYTLKEASLLLTVNSPRTILAFTTKYPRLTELALRLAVPPGGGVPTGLSLGRFDLPSLRTLPAALVVFGCCRQPMEGVEPRPAASRAADVWHKHPSNNPRPCRWARSSAARNPAWFRVGRYGVLVMVAVVGKLYHGILPNNQQRNLQIEVLQLDALSVIHAGNTYNIQSLQHTIYVQQAKRRKSTNPQVHKSNKTNLI